MEKINVVLVLLNSVTLEETLKKLNLDNINLTMILNEGDPEENFITVGEDEIPRMAFFAAYKIENTYKDFIWVVSGGSNDVEFLAKTNSFLEAINVPEGNIVNLEVFAQISETWLANLRYIEEHGAEFFATGNEYMRDGLNFNFIPDVRTDKNIASGGVNLADPYQDLRQSYLLAKHVFAHVAPGTIKFVLIGLSPYSFRYDNAKDLPHKKNPQYLFALRNFAEEDTRAELLDALFNDDVKKIFETTTSAQADLNFDGIKAELNREFSVKAIADWEDNTRPFTNVAADGNIQILKDYIELCLANGAKPVGVVFPFFAAVKKAYSKKILRDFRTALGQLKEVYNFPCIDMFDINIGFECFCDMTHLNSTGSSVTNALIALKLFNDNLIPAENFCNMNYEYFDRLSSIAPKDEYNALMESVFNASAQIIRRKDKIRVGFVIYEASQWCGDDLYNIFAANERFETTVFFCLQVSHMNNELVKREFLRGVDQFKSHGLNVVAMDTWKAKMPTQDVLIFLTPYLSALTKVFRFKNLTAKTLTAYITYSYSISVRGKGGYNKPLLNVAWKVFLPSTSGLKVYRERSNLGLPRSLCSGYPRMDIFFKNDTDFHFDWKMARPDAKKIIWAPHWAINCTVNYATFHRNYQFFYEFAKAHPETSWIVKPHPNLVFRVVEEKIFPSAEAFNEYLQQWDDLPNAQVYTGAYYQAIFATSDGMIHDSGSFIAEYQFVNKPMIFLTKEDEVFNELGNEILKASYLVEGKDLDGIAALMQRVFIEGDDYKAAERKEVFDKYLNYPEYNGMLASEFIFKSIADEFKEPSA